MAVIDLEALTAPVSPDQPCGPNMEYDREFAAFERLAQGKPERQMGDVVQPAEEPDWKQLGDQAKELLAKTKDLRIACQLTKALLRTSGIVGFGEGVHLVRALLERYWAGIHPLLDADDDNDPAMRVNTLAGLADAATLAALRLTPIVNARGVGKFGLRDIQAATGEVPLGPDPAAPDLAAT